MKIRRIATTLGNSDKVIEKKTCTITPILLNGVPCRLYKPSEVKNDCLIIYIHGGGYCVYNAKAYDYIVEEIINNINCYAISIDYTLAPTKYFPSPIMECWSVIEEIASKNNNLLKDISIDKVVLMGDSAGGNATAVLTQKAAQTYEYRHFFKGHVLIYPYLGSWDFNSESVKSYNDYPLFSVLSPEMMAEFILIYLGVKASSENLNMILKSDSMKGNFDETSELSKFNDNIELSPILASDSILKKLPKSLTIIANYDILKDQGILYYERMKKVQPTNNNNDDKHSIKIFDKLTHGEINTSYLAANRVVLYICQWLKEAKIIE
uniref:Abhydrolase_3 domain-containing protein n=1 Tax=Parastrongyloides trichosuri TaxID=131310 RepID=A0A0N5A4Q5_PARTI